MSAGHNAPPSPRAGQCHFARHRLYKLSLSTHSIHARPIFQEKKSESRAFRFSAPRVWNSLPVSIRVSQVTSYFQTSLKDILLSVSLPHFSCPPCLEYLCPCALILLRLWRYINHVLTYLLIYFFWPQMSAEIVQPVDKKTWQHHAYIKPGNLSLL